MWKPRIKDMKYLIEIIIEIRGVKNVILNFILPWELTFEMGRSFGLRLFRSESLLTRDRSDWDRSESLLIRDRSVWDRSKSLLIRDRSEWDRSESLLIRDRSEWDRSESLFIRDRSVWDRSESLLIRDRSGWDWPTYRDAAAWEWLRCKFCLWRVLSA